MEGLPVRRWEMMEVTIKQEVKDDEKNHESKEGTNPDWPWPDLPLPKDFHLLPAHSQVRSTNFQTPQLLTPQRNSFGVPAHLTKIPILPFSTDSLASMSVLTSIPAIQLQ